MTIKSGEVIHQSNLKRNIYIGIAIMAIAGCLLIALFFFAYPTMERNYQLNMNVIRKKDASVLAALMREYSSKTGRLPFQEESQDKPVMVIIGRSSEQEQAFETDPTLKRNATYKRSTELEALLTKGLGREVHLPREPQKIATFAPNVYVYFVAGNQFAVAVHLSEPDKDAVAYRRKNGNYYSYTLTYGKEK